MKLIYLKKHHPLLDDDAKCWVCERRFFEHERITLVPFEAPKPVHATCAWRGMKTDVGIIERILDGDGSPFPVRTTDGKQYKLEEIGCTEC